MTDWTKNNTGVIKCKTVYFSGVAALGSQLVDLRLSDVGTFLGFFELMLNLPELRHVSVGLLLLRSQRE